MNQAFNNYTQLHVSTLCKNFKQIYLRYNKCLQLLNVSHLENLKDKNLESLQSNDDSLKDR